MFDDIDPFSASPRELLARIVDLEPGPLSMSLLLMVDRRSLGSEDAVTFLQVHERLTSWWAAIQAEAMIAAASPEALVDEFTILEPRVDREAERTIRIQDAVREELSSALRWSPATTQARIEAARLLEGPLAGTRRALALGEVSTGHVAVVIDAARRLPGLWSATAQEARAFASCCHALEQRILPVARRGTPSMTRQAANRAVLAIDADGQRRRRESARCTRGVWVVDELDGISVLMARMATEQAHAVMAAVDTAAHAVPGELDSPGTPRLTIGERRTDALADLVLSHESESRPVVRAHLDLVVPLSLLLDPANHDSTAAELTGCGAVDAGMVLDLLADPTVDVTMRRLVVGPVSGTLLDVGRRSYDVPTRLRELIVLRDRTCRFPGCQRRAARCQIDHADAWEDGGATDAANLGALCVRHHQLKTHGGWDLVDSDPSGACTWISPQGRRYRHPPHVIPLETHERGQPRVPGP
jgi:hypothetical protein